MTDDKTRALLEAAEKHQEVVVCGNPRHTNFDIGCPDCAVVCDYCTCPWPCDARRLADALSALTVPDGDARERLVESIAGGTISIPGGYGELARDDAENIVDTVVCDPALSRAAAPEPLPVGGDDAAL